MTDRQPSPEIVSQAIPTDGILFSVVIATFNRGDRIVPTIRSVLRQTWRDFEILVVGDGCTDNTGELLATNFGDSVTWINLDRNYGSQSLPNNEGVRRARGSHVAYLGHDDIWSPAHLAAMARTIEASDPDFAVSGAILYPQRGIPEYGLSGLFDDPDAARREFFPPSSWAHRRDVLERIGPWGDPNELDRPVDLELQQRAVRAGLAFASTGIITVHKFAAISRYMSYRFQDADEQQLVLDCLGDPLGERRLLTEILGRVLDGATLASRPHGDYSGEDYRARRKRMLWAKGVEVGPPIVVNDRTTIPIDESPGLRDWRAVRENPRLGRHRWSHDTPNPNYFLNIQAVSPFSLRIHLVRVGEVESLGLRVDDVPVRYSLEQGNNGTFWMIAWPEPDLPIEEGLKLTFVTQAGDLPKAAGLPQARRIAIGDIVVVPA